MQQGRNNYLIFSGMAAVAGGLLHIATIFGGPAWYRIIGATEEIVQMAAKGHAYPAVICLFAATVLFTCAGFAFSGAGLIRRLPLLRTGLVLITAALLVHGIAFIPMVLYAPKAMAAVYDGEGINTIVIVTNLICLLAALGYGLGARQAWPAMKKQAAR